MTTRKSGLVLPPPAFYEARRASEWGYSPQMREVFEEAQRYRAAHQIHPSAMDSFRLHFLVIDAQKDFCLPEGTLYVGGRSGTGAIDDSRRIAEFIYANLPHITEITATLDSHFAFQIFSPSFWNDESGQPLQPHDVITGDLIVMRMGQPAGRALVNPAMAAVIANGNYTWLVKQAQHYCQALERGGKYQLYIWPEHCIIGSSGHTLVGLVDEARMFHSYVRYIQSNVEVKGGNPLTENYSVLSPEVLTRFDGRGSLAQKNTRFIETLLTSDAVVVAGQAASHCVASSIDDLLGEISARDPELAKKVYILEDGTSAVAVPDGSGGFAVDFTEQAEAALNRFRDAGMHVVKSTDPIETWPDIRLGS